jgi:D-amino-acid dehydrogenase
VVGGGIVGSSVAYHLAAAGEDVVLIDRDDPGQATAAGAGIVAPGLSITLPLALEPLAFQAVRYYGQLLQKLGDKGQTAVEYQEVGLLHVARSDQEKAQLRDTYELFVKRREAGFANIGELSMADGAALRALCPALDDAHAGIHATGAARVDGRSLRDALLGAFEHDGGERRVGNARVVTSGSRATGVEVDGDRLAADIVVLATGAWSDALESASGVEWGIAPQRGQIVHLELRDVETTRWPILQGYEPYYVITFPPHRVVIGATREHGTGFDRRVTAAGQHEVLRQGLAYAPGLADATVVETRVGFRPVTADGLPLIGPLRGCEGLFVATGLGHLGLTLGPSVGALIAAVALEAPTAVDLTPFALDRASLSQPATV